MALDETLHITVRMPSGLRDRLRASAAINRRSMNSEIVRYLDQTVETYEAKGPAATAIAPSQEHDQPR